jgi:UDP-N-acetyl-D-glucosamine dehydrogenase
MLEEFLHKVETREAIIGIVGIGYVGLPVALSFAEAGFHVIGIDLRKEKIRALEEGRSHLLEISSERVKAQRDAGRLRASSSFEPLRNADAVIISVPTPLAAGTPDLSRVVFAGEEIAKVLKRGSLFVLESTTYPGTTEELLQPLLEVGGDRAGTDFMLAYSPERIDPGNPSYDFKDIPKVVGGIDESSAQAAMTLYQQVVPKVIPVSGTREAEMAKLIENTFRHVNIALINELALYSHDLGVDIWEAIEAAATKPFGFMPFWPSPGWGGHCIPLDPSYLSWRVRQQRSHEIRFIELAQSIHAEMPRHVIERTSLLLNDEGKALRSARVLGVGVAYKAGTEDTRESAGIRILGGLEERGALVTYHDPLVPRVGIGGSEHTSVELTADLIAEQDIVIIFVPQSNVDWESVAQNARRVLDCCNALRRRAPHITRL